MARIETPTSRKIFEVTGFRHGNITSPMMTDISTYIFEGISRSYYRARRGEAKWPTAFSPTDER